MRTLLRRLGFYVLAAYAAITLNFFLIRLLPGSALSNILTQLRGSSLSPATVKALEEEYGGGHSSTFSQYFTYVGHLFKGDFGTSTSKGGPVVDVLTSDLPWTIGLVGSATIIAFVAGTLAGIVIGWKRNGFLDALLPIATFFQSVPYLVLAILMMLTFGYYGGFFPYGGNYDTSRNAHLTEGWNGPFIGSVLQHGTLPALTVALASIAGWIIGMRNMMITTMDEDYVLVAAAKGLPQWRVAAVAARNAILPALSNFALSISLVVTGSIVTEIVFSYQGVGTDINNAVLAGDYPLMQGVLLVIVFTVLAINFLADIAYVLLDPRARKEA
ncbi:ABC transporter permease [Streptacidiphilus monticola]|uniref:ABC transporter permease n=1 Tax=Streptacidiphilus monticola TaxID=2161674 RepID=A0ABW1G5J4_9ACTN